MTKQEAILAMREGKKVTHVSFTPDEWVSSSGTVYKFEDGNECSDKEFWAYRKDDSFYYGWSEWSEEKSKRTNFFTD